MKYLLFIIFTILLYNHTKADEGMWLLTDIKKLNLPQKGSNLNYQQIYNSDSISIKDAIVGLGTSENPLRFFCSAEIVSNQGLVFTNYHCAYHVIQQLSNLDNNYIKQGYWATNNSDELYTEGITASIVLSVTDITDSIFQNLPDTLSQKSREIFIDSLCKRIEINAKDSQDIKTSVVSYFDNNQYFLYTYLVYEDIRLVGVPPQSIGKFGGDTDNWFWPRHTADFAVLRIYTDSTGNPAKYNENNIPLIPKHFLPISIKGYKEDDISFTMGFPGSTERYITSAAVENIYNITNKERHNIRQVKLDIIHKYMDEDEDIFIKYASKRARISNYWKYFKGQNLGIEKLNVIEQKKVNEQKIALMLNESDKKTYDSVLNIINDIEYRLGDVLYASDYYREIFMSGAEISFFPFYFQKYLKLLKEHGAKSDEVITETKILQNRIDKYFINYSQMVDKHLFIELFKLFNEKVSDMYKPELFNEINKKYKSNYEKYANYVFKKSIFASEERLNNFLSKPNASKLENDPAYNLMLSLLSKYRENRKMYKPEQDILESTKHIYSKILLNYFSDSLMYPDANSTLRLSYGYINGYKPSDAVYYRHYTTHNGILEKEKIDNPDYYTPSDFIDILNKKDFAPYSSNDSLITCFISNNDITGGNSGSAVINKNGELIGIAFDGNWESMSGDIIYEPDFQRCINVDIRYVLYILDKYANMQRIIDELLIIN